MAAKSKGTPKKQPLKATPKNKGRKAKPDYNEKIQVDASFEELIKVLVQPRKKK